MIQLFADGNLVYDSRVADVPLAELTATLAVNKGGTATIKMPPQHPAYHAFTSYKTIVDIYRDGVRHFRGRALYPTDDFKLFRTITCEGEKCFFRDAIIRPYGLKGSPKDILTYLIGLYNNEVEKPKQFKVGDVTVTSLEGDIVIENEEAETFADTIDKLTETYGGYIVFTDDVSGDRLINWYAKLEYHSSQVIELGSNLIDFTRTSSNSDLANVIVPYGSTDDTGNRIDIKSVNNGLDYIEDEDSVRLRGRIAKVVTFNDITDPVALLQKAKETLAQTKDLVSSLTLTAVDLSLIDKSIDSFMVGDRIKVHSKAHGVYSETYLLTEQSIDFLHASNDRITLGTSSSSLTGADAAANKATTTSLQQLTQATKSDMASNKDSAIEETKTNLTSMIQQTSESIMQEVSEQYTSNEELQSELSSSMTQLSDAFNFVFNELYARVNTNDSIARTQFATIEKYIRFKNGDIILGEVDNAITLRISNDRISFMDNGAEVAYLSDNRLTVRDGRFLKSLQLGNFEFKIRENGNLSLFRING